MMASFNASRVAAGFILPQISNRNFSVQASAIGHGLVSSPTLTVCPNQIQGVVNNSGPDTTFNRSMSTCRSLHCVSNLPLDSCFVNKPTRRLRSSLLDEYQFGNSRSCSSRSKYGTWALTSFSRSNAARIQPVLEVEKLLENLDSYKDVIKKRNLQGTLDLSKLPELYNEAKRLKMEKEEAERARDANTAKVQGLLKLQREKKSVSENANELRDKGKLLREDLRNVTNRFHEVNDNLINMILSIPNLLDSMTPTTAKFEVLRDVGVKEGVEKFTLPEDYRWDIVKGAGPYAEYAVGAAAMLELDLAGKCQKLLISDGFSETGNVDFVKRILLDGPGLDPNQFLQIREPNIKPGKSHASYLVGGASFPAFLALFAQSVIQDTSRLPIKFFVIGRCYNKRPKLDGPLQNTAVQVFVACTNEEQQEQEFCKLAGLMEKFYAEILGVGGQSRLLPASELRQYEKKKMAFVSFENDKTLGDLATVGDYVSKRLLCCYNDKRIPKFLHLITGQFFNITDFLRPFLPAKCIEIIQEPPKFELIMPEPLKLDKPDPNNDPIPSAAEKSPPPPSPSKSSTTSE